MQLYYQEAWQCAFHQVLYRYWFFGGYVGVCVQFWRVFSFAWFFLYFTKGETVASQIIHKQSLSAD